MCFSFLNKEFLHRGAKPAAFIYWNSEPPVDLSNFITEVTPNGNAFDTINQLTFRAERKLTSLSCFASNQVLDEQKGVHLTQATTINVRYRPRIDKAPSVEPTYRVQGESVTLYCKYEANPVSGTLVTWYREGRVVAFGKQEKENFLRASADASILRIGTLERGQEGRYSCAAENVVGRSSIVDVAVIKVEIKPRVTLSVDPASAVSETLNANVTLMCLSDRNEEKFRAVKWFLDGELLKHVEIPSECFKYDDQNNTHSTKPPSSSHSPT